MKMTLEVTATAHEDLEGSLELRIEFPTDYPFNPFKVSVGDGTS